MKNRFKFILIMVMAIVCTMTANAQKYVYFATHRYVRNEFGENTKNAYCPTRIELDLDAKTLFIKTKTRGSVSYTFSDLRFSDKGVWLYNEKDEIIGGIIFRDTDLTVFHGLGIERKDGSTVHYYVNDY